MSRVVDDLAFISKLKSKEHIRPFIEFDHQQAKLMYMNSLSWQLARFVNHFNCLRIEIRKSMLK